MDGTKTNITLKIFYQNTKQARGVTINYKKRHCLCHVKDMIYFLLLQSLGFLMGIYHDISVFFFIRGRKDNEIRAAISKIERNIGENVFD